MLSGGGIASMYNVLLIVGIASGYSVIFERTGLTAGLMGVVHRMGEKLGSFLTVWLVSTAACMIVCNQAFGVILTGTLCKEIQPDKKQLAIDLENTVILMAALVPWSIASSTPLAAIGAPAASLLFACYLYLVPLCNVTQGHIFRHILRSRP